MIKIMAIPPVVEGDPVTVRAMAPPGYVTAAACIHGGDKPEEIRLRREGSVLVGTFKPSAPGRWWVAVKHADATAERCFWATERHVSF